MSLTFDLHRNPTPASDERRATIHANPGFGVFFTDHMLAAVWTQGRRLGRRPGRAVRPDPADAERRGAALRAGDLRGPQGLPARRRLGVVVPARGQRRADAAQRPSPGPARAADRRLRRVAARPGRGRRAVGAAGRHRRDEPLPAPLHVRLGGLPRRAPGQRGHLLRHRLAGRGLLRRRRSSRSRCGSRSTTPAPAPVAPARRRPAATTRRRWPASSRASSTGATRSSSSTPRRRPTSRSSAG